MNSMGMEPTRLTQQPIPFSAIRQAPQPVLIAKGTDTISTFPNFAHAPDQKSELTEVVHNIQTNLSYSCPLNNLEDSRVFR